MADPVLPPPNPPVLEVRNLVKTYTEAGRSLTVLSDIQLRVLAGETCAIIGPSGSGKTTLLGLCAGLDDATSGSVLLDGRALEDLAQDGRAALRGRCVGFVFQNFQLIPTLTALENVLVPNSGRRWRGLLCGLQRFFLPMNPLEIWMPLRAHPLWTCFLPSTARTGRPWCW